MKGFANETVTVDVPEDGTGRKLEVFMVPLEASITNWGLARKFGPLNSMRPAEDSSQVFILQTHAVDQSRHYHKCMSVASALPRSAASTY